MILLDRLTKTYNKRTKALDTVNLHIQPKEFVCIVGPSGAGKSTLIKLLTREEKPTSGKIIVGGIDYDTLKERDIPYLRRKIGVVFQDFKLLPKRNVYENIAFAMEITGTRHKIIEHTVPKVLKLVGLTGKENNFPAELSGGERQRVAIARAVIRQPKILIADEPTGNLDPKHAWDIIELLLKINHYGTTVLLTTHNKEIVDTLKRRVITLRDGKIISDQQQGKYKLEADEEEAKPSKAAAVRGK